jgi:hypothetical protein
MTDSPKGLHVMSFFISYQSGTDMSQLNLTISNESVIPTIETDWFKGHEDTTFAIGMIAIGDQILAGRGTEFDGYLKLRANVYAYQTRMIPTDYVKGDGTETDEDDARSTHWALLERSAEGEGLANVVGSIRTIEKRPTDGRPLPIEDFFPEVFESNPLALGSIEVSRYIARHPNELIQNKLSEPLFKKVISHITAHGLGPTFGVVELKVEDHLTNRLHVPLARIAEPKYVPEYAADNLGIAVDIPTMAIGLGINNDRAINSIRATEHDVEYFNFGAGAHTTAA